MRLVPIPVVALLAGLVAGSAEAQLRAPSANVQRSEAGVDSAATRSEQSEAWLGRLPGQYRVEYQMGSLQSGSGHDIPGDTSQGRTDCEVVGGGPGVSCLTSLVMGASNDKAVSIMLFGVDPESPQIRLLEVGSFDAVDSGTREGFGTLLGDAVTFTMRCRAPAVRQAADGCHQIMTIYAPPNGMHVELSAEPDVIPPGAVAERARSSARRMKWFREAEQAPARMRP